jgi:ATP-dependent RNA helicase DDX54/DBP10
MSRYSLIDGASSFAEQARGVAFDLAGDEGTAADRKQRQLHWDKKKKKFIKGDGVGSDNVKLVKTENGTRLPATYRSGRFDEWKATNHVSLPNAGEAENEARRGKRLSGGPGGPTFKHNKVVAAKPLHKLNKDYQRKTRLMRKKAEGAGNDARSPSSAATKVGGRYRGKPMERVKTELKTAEQIRKRRKMLDKRKAKNGRTTRGKKGR